jgi:hypothetical protein
VVNLQNIGSLMMEGGDAFLNIDPQYLSVTNPELAIPDLDYGESTQLVFTMNCNWTCPPENMLMTVLNISSNEGFFQQSFPLNFTAGAIIEDWETVGFNKFDWSNGGNKLWAISFLDPFQGSCAAKSGNIDDGQVSYLMVTMDVIGYDDISFYRKVSSENSSDYLRFYIDNNLSGEWSGELGWEKASFQVTPGFHTFKWAFEKDNLNSQGTDCGWVDYIVFPSCNMYGTLEVLANAIPHEFCGPVSSQLGAYVLGGSGNYTFQWQPDSLLDDPTSQFPHASAGQTTTFTVEVNDGENTTGSEVLVSSYPVPQAAVIYQQGDSLISQVSSGNHWYNNDGPIAGATGQVYFPQTETEYFVMVTNEYDCISDTSNIIYFIFTGLVETESKQEILVYPNPFFDAVSIDFNKTSRQEITIKLMDFTGKEILETHYNSIDFQDVILLRTVGLKKSLYLLSITDEEGRLLLSRKIMKY